MIYGLARLIKAIACGIILAGVIYWLVYLILMQFHYTHYADRMLDKQDTLLAILSTVIFPFMWRALR